MLNKKRHTGRCEINIKWSSFESKCLPNKTTLLNTDNTENSNLKSVVQENNISI